MKAGPEWAQMGTNLDLAVSKLDTDEREATKNPA